MISLLYRSSSVFMYRTLDKSLKRKKKNHKILYLQSDFFGIHIHLYITTGYCWWHVDMSSVERLVQPQPDK